MARTQAVEQVPELDDLAKTIGRMAQREYGTERIRPLLSTATTAYLPNLIIAGRSGTGTLTMNCTGIGNKPMRFCISIGGGSAFDATSRFMNGLSSGQLRYQLYSDTARTIPWDRGCRFFMVGGFSGTFPQAAATPPSRPRSTAASLAISRPLWKGYIGAWRVCHVRQHHPATLP